MNRFFPRAFQTPKEGNNSLPEIWPARHGGDEGGGGEGAFGMVMPIVLALALTTHGLSLIHI